MSHPRQFARFVRILLPAIVVVFAALLRIHALTLTYGHVNTPAWVDVLQRGASAAVHPLLPDRVAWAPASMHPHRDGPDSLYFSDPYTYLQFARQMRSFYAGHYREPLFVFATKVWLHLLHDRDVAVSFASVSFSVLAVAAIYLLGALAFSPWVGLGAALALAIEYEVISEATTGGRDPAFMFAVIIAAYAMVRFSRSASAANALWLGAAAGIACLIRITSLSFLLPGFLYLLLVPNGAWKPRVQWLAAAALVAAALVGPYLFNCWRTFGDPLYSINSLTSNNLAMEGRQVEAPPTAMAYVKEKVFSRPVQTIDTMALGLTAHPFLNKWRGFDRWLPGLGVVLSWVTVAGLILWAGSPPGRLLLLLLATSLLPFCVTWKLASDWRFTAHAYPFFLIAACAAVARVVTAVSPSAIKSVEGTRRFDRRRAIFWTAVLSAVALVAWIMLRLMPVLLVREALSAREEGMLQSGDRDGAFFGEGWSAPATVGTLTMRVSQPPTSSLSLPLPSIAPYRVTVRLEPFPRPIDGAPGRLPLLHVWLNGQFLGDLQTRVNTTRVGSYDVHLPSRLIHAGANRLTFTVDPAAGGGSTAGPQFALWYARIHPPEPSESWLNVVEVTPTPLTGRLESAQCASLVGWVADLGWLDTPADVDVFDGDTRIATIAAADLRRDLVGKMGNGRHGFSYPLPASVTDGRPHTISVRVAGAAQHLEGSPVTVNCTAPRARRPPLP